MTKNKITKPKDKRVFISKQKSFMYVAVPIATTDTPAIENKFVFIIGLN